MYVNRIDRNSDLPRQSFAGKGANRLGFSLLHFNFFCHCSAIYLRQETPTYYISAPRNSYRYAFPETILFKKEMQTCYVPPLFYWCIVRMLLFLFCFIFFAIPFVVSSFQLSNRPHPRLSNASDQEALLGFMSAITHDPLHLASDWKRNVSFCDWTGITCSRRRQRVVSLDVSSMGLQGEVPKGGVFKKLGAAAFIGNLGLCGPWGILKCGAPKISYGELILATNEFSDANLLGVGSFGKVYKGVLNDGTSIAVKLLDVQNEGAHKSFNRECKVLGRVRHRNLIRIITSYSDLQVKALIFPLMSNGSLEKWLYPDGEDQSSLSLIQRLNIAIDIAEGLVYLHHHCFVQVIHCDLKPNNVLLGEDMTAYIIDFGIATICFANSEDSALTSTHALKGSAGYIPPEYGFGGPVTTKGDVYSYGIMLLQMITRKRPTDNMFEEGMNLPKWVGSTFPNQVGNVVDTSLLRIMSNMSIEEDKDLNCLRELISVGLLCTKESPEGRPTMIDIVGALKNMRETFLGVTGIPKFQSDITYLLGNSSTTHNNTGQTQSSSTF